MPGRECTRGIRYTVGSLRCREHSGQPRIYSMGHTAYRVQYRQDRKETKGKMVLAFVRNGYAFVQTLFVCWRESAQYGSW